MAPKRKKKVNHAEGEAQRRLWQYLAVYTAAVLLLCTGTLVRYDLEAADDRLGEVESRAETIVETERVTEVHEEYGFAERRIAIPESLWEERSWLEEITVIALIIIVSQIIYPFFPTLLIFFAGKKTARKTGIGDDEATGILFVSSALACAGAFIFLAGVSNGALLITSGFLVITCGWLAGMAYAVRRESKWLAAVPPFAALAIEIAYYIFINDRMFYLIM